LIVTLSSAHNGAIPAGVPVEMMLPGSSVITDEMNAMSQSIGKISCCVVEDWRRVPLTHPSTAMPSGAD
jgi:hypothetical protein